MFVSSSADSGLMVSRPPWAYIKCREKYKIHQVSTISLHEYTTEMHCVLGSAVFLLLVCLLGGAQAQVVSSQGWGAGGASFANATHHWFSTPYFMNSHRRSTRSASHCFDQSDSRIIHHTVNLIQKEAGELAMCMTRDVFFKR